MDKDLYLLANQGLKKVQDLGLDATILTEQPPKGDRHTDLVFEFKRGQERVRYVVEVKRHVTPATLGVFVRQFAQPDQNTLLLADYVTPPLAERLRENGIEFIDAAGNAYLNQGPFFVWVKGQRPATKPQPPEIGRAFQPTGLQVLFTFLCDPQTVNAPYREIAKMAGVAHGTVGWVMADLQQLGFLPGDPAKRKTRKLFDLPRLLEQWTEHYARLLRPKTHIHDYYAPTIEAWGEWPLKQHKLLWGGEPAAALMTGYLKPGELTLYGEKLPGLFAAQHRLVRDPLPGYVKVQVRKKFWNFEHKEIRDDVTPAVLVYADLLATGDPRCIETAKLIYDEHINRLVEQ